MPRYLGLDSSTQSLSALVVDTDSGSVVLDESLNFGATLPEYGSPNGFLEHADARVKHSNPLMWVDALDRLLEGARARGFDWGTVAGVSGAGQQHGSVYLSTPIAKARPWSSSEPLARQVAPLLSRKTSPIWMDSSTSAECREIAAAVGGDENVTRSTGSRAIERFTGPQIRKFFKDDPAAYERTAEIHLVSSFVAALLTQSSAPIDYGDGAGMTLLDLESLTWNEKLLAATAPGLAEKLRRPVASATAVGPIAPYFVEKYGFRSGTPVVAFTGDNPSSLVGMGATEPGTAVVSLGTSDTVFAAMRSPKTDPRGFGHVFGNPAGGFMCLICYSNGSLAREAVAKKAGLDWPAFERAILEETKPGNGQNLMLPFFVPEITPRLSNPAVKLFGSPDFVAFRSPAEAARAVVEAQALSMLHHSDWIGERPKEILVTGGAAKNRGVLQVISDVFQADLKTLSVANASALGGALRAANAVGRVGFAELAARFSAPDSARAVRPTSGSDKAYDALRSLYAEKLAELG
ncbi:MAG TPA: FGGY-family carbohydrate kinase [Polyangiaceae bacterium]|nr:FGGY-family carbohydrate kinase [Polyangiaceae bacterium]